jgi:hypothetical protein
VNTGLESSNTAVIERLNGKAHRVPPVIIDIIGDEEHNGTGVEVKDPRLQYQRCVRTLKDMFDLEEG